MALVPTSSRGNLTPPVVLTAPAGLAAPLLKLLSELNTDLFHVDPSGSVVLSTESGVASTTTIIGGTDFAGNAGFRVRADGQLIVWDTSNNPIFRVDPDGALHGKTGKSLTFDL